MGLKVKFKFLLIIPFFTFVIWGTFFCLAFEKFDREIFQNTFLAIKVNCLVMFVLLPFYSRYFYYYLDKDKFVISFLFAKRFHLDELKQIIFKKNKILIIKLDGSIKSYVNFLSSKSYLELKKYKFDKVEFSD